MDSILHILGVCGDNHSHFDLLDTIMVLGGGSAGIITIKTYYKTVIYIIKEKLNQWNR